MDIIMSRGSVRVSLWDGLPEKRGSAFPEASNKLILTDSFLNQSLVRRMRFPLDSQAHYWSWGSHLLPLDIIGYVGEGLLSGMMWGEDAVKAIWYPQQ